MPDKVDVTVEIELYRMEVADYYRKYPFMFILMVLLPLPGIILFIRWNRKKRLLDQKRMEVQKMLSDLATTIPLTEYLDMKKRFNTARQY